MFRHERLAPARYQFQCPVPVSVPVSVAVTVTVPLLVPFLVRHSTRRSLSHCVILARRATAGVAPVFFFFSVVPLLFLLCSLLRICCTVVSCLEEDGRTAAGCVFNLVPQAAAAAAENRQLCLRLELTKCTGYAASEMHSKRNGTASLEREGQGRGSRVSWSICATVTVTHES